MNDNRDHLRALHAAYVEVSGIPVTLSPDRMATMREFDRRKLTPHDVRVVIAGIKSHIKKGTKGFNQFSIDWRNAMANVDIFEERALKARQFENRKPKPVPVVAHTTALGNGEAVTSLAPAAPSEVPKIDMRKALRELAEKFEKP